jgi:hypothetical protein
LHLHNIFFLNFRRIMIDEQQVVGFRITAHQSEILFGIFFEEKAHKKTNRARLDLLKDILENENPAFRVIMQNVNKGHISRAWARYIQWYDLRLGLGRKLFTLTQNMIDNVGQSSDFINPISVRLLLGKVYSVANIKNRHNYLPDYLNEFLRKCFVDTSTETWSQEDLDALFDFESVIRTLFIPIYLSIWNHLIDMEAGDVNIVSKFNHIE